MLWREIRVPGFQKHSKEETELFVPKGELFWQKGQDREEDRGDLLLKNWIQENGENMVTVNGERLRLCPQVVISSPLLSSPFPCPIWATILDCTHNGLGHCVWDF